MTIRAVGSYYEQWVSFSRGLKTVNIDDLIVSTALLTQRRVCERDNVEYQHILCCLSFSHIEKLQAFWN